MSVVTEVCMCKLCVSVRAYGRCGKGVQSKWSPGFGSQFSIVVRSRHKYTV